MGHHSPAALVPRFSSRAMLLQHLQGRHVHADAQHSFSAAHVSWHAAARTNTCLMSSREKLDDARSGAAMTRLPQGSSSRNRGDNACTSLPVRSAPRQRKWAPKVKTGCMTCRLRRIKCDEAKPVCRRCASTSRQCAGHGYGCTRNTPVGKPALRPKQNKNALVLASQPGFAVSPSEVASSDEEMTMFHFFRTEAATRLAGAFDEKFCTMDLLQASKFHPAVWHACTALAAMYRRESIAHATAPESEQHRFYVLALKQYDASIKSVVKLIQGPSDNQTSYEILLTSCLVFTAICCLQGNLTTALVHLRNGQKLFHQWKNAARGGAPSNHLINAKAFIALLSRLCTQTIDLRNGPWEDWDVNTEAQAELSPEPYTSPVEAYLEFEPICNGFMELRHRGSRAVRNGQVGPAEELRQAYQQVLAAWAAKFHHLQASKSLSASEFEGMLILEARYLSFYIDLNRDPESEMHWDTFQPEFARIVHLAERIFETSGQAVPLHQRTRGTLATRVFTFSSSVMDAVFNVARYCRHYATRHKALHLLQNWSIKEGICDTRIASVIAAGLMGVEERPGKTNRMKDGPPECICDGFFICHDDRIKVILGEFVQDGKAAMTARTVRDVRLDLPGTFVPVSW